MTTGLIRLEEVLPRLPTFWGLYLETAHDWAFRLRLGCATVLVSIDATHCVVVQGLDAPLPLDDARDAARAVSELMVRLDHIDWQASAMRPTRQHPRLILRPPPPTRD